MAFTTIQADCYAFCDNVRKCAVGLRSFLTCEIRESFSFYEDSFREGLCFIWLFEERVLSYFIENNYIFTN